VIQSKAIPYLQKALRYDANLLEAHASLGKAYLRAGRPDAAVTELEKVLQFDFYGDLHYCLLKLIAIQERQSWPAPRSAGPRR
jgi:tetratricopeptide (TPR) repeat protein